jgi:hypothetical protein
MMKAVQNRRAHLSVQLRFQHRWKVNAPKVAGSVPLERFENEPRGKATSNSGLNYLSRLQMTN